MGSLRLLLMLVSASLATIGTLQSAHAMSFGKHNNSGDTANQNMTQGNGHGNGNGDRAPGTSLDANPYQVPVPEPSTVVLLASGLLGVGVWRWKKAA
jgi:hypothetical protein